MKKPVFTTKGLGISPEPPKEAKKILVSNLNKEYYKVFFNRIRNEKPISFEEWEAKINNLCSKPKSINWFKELTQKVNPAIGGLTLSQVQDINRILQEI